MPLRVKKPDGICPRKLWQRGNCKSVIEGMKWVPSNKERHGQKWLRLFRSHAYILGSASQHKIDDYPYHSELIKFPNLVEADFDHQNKATVTLSP